MKLKSLSYEFLAGLTTSMAMIPESMAFAILATVSPIYGLYTAFVVGLIAAIIGRPALISGGAGAIAIVGVGLVIGHGPEYLFAAVILMGLIQIIAGLLKAGKLIMLVEEPIMAGFLNGLAIIIFMSQFVHFKTLGHWMYGAEMVTMILVTIATIGLMFLSKKIIKNVPGPLIAITIIVIVLELFDIKTKTIGDIASVAGGFPKFHIPIAPISFETLWIILPYSLIMASVGLLESLLTKKVVDDKFNESTDNNLECVAQGSANMVSGFFGGIGGCGMIGQTIVNLESKGKIRWSGIFMAVSVLLFILVGAPIIEKIPIASLAALMFLVAIKAFQWEFFKSINQTPKFDIFVMIVVTTVTLITHNLALAVGIGVILTVLDKAYYKYKQKKLNK